MQVPLLFVSGPSSYISTFSHEQTSFVHPEKIRSMHHHSVLSIVLWVESFRSMTDVMDVNWLAATIGSLEKLFCTVFTNSSNLLWSLEVNSPNRWLLKRKLDAKIGYLIDLIKATITLLGFIIRMIGMKFRA